MQRTIEPKNLRMRKALMEPTLILRELNNRSFYHFLQYFWSEYTTHEYIDNWHIKYLCDQLQNIAEAVGNRQKKVHDLIINIPPGTTKTTICSIMFPAWCWTRWYWMRFITVSYAALLSLESAEYSRDLVRSQRFRQLYPELDIKADKDTKGNFRVVRKKQHFQGRAPRIEVGGNRYSTSVGGTLTGFHADIIIVDDPLNPTQAISEAELNNTNRWIDNTLPTRKTDKANTPTIMIMQRLHENDPSGYLLAKNKQTTRHICLPGEIVNYGEYLKPTSLEKEYIDGLLDVRRLSWEVLDELKTDLGQYGFAGQIGQNPVPPGGGMFKVDFIGVLETIPPASEIRETVRYWDKAGTKEQVQGGRTKAAYTVGTKMHVLKNGKWLISDVKRGRWSADERERIIRMTAEADGVLTTIYHEQEPGSGGKESAESTIRNLSGFSSYADRPIGDKIFRADPFSVQVNNGNVLILRADWNRDWIDELRLFPFSTFKDQVDSAAGAYSKLTGRRKVRVY